MKIYKEILFIIITILIGCKNISNLSIEKEQIILFEIIEIYSLDQDYIIISGLIGNSAYNYKALNIVNNKQSKSILMYAELSVLNKNGSGSFDITIPIDKNINQILFGKNNEKIWERKSDEILFQREKILELQKYTNYNDIINKFGEPDDVIGSGFLIIEYTLINNRKAILNFGTNRNGLLQLIEVVGYDNKKLYNENVIFNF
jgi:hypothetical protein